MMLKEVSMDQSEMHARNIVYFRAKRKTTARPARNLSLRAQTRNRGARNSGAAIP
jgi:hypothetical protein